MTYLARDQLDWGDDRLIIKEREPDPNSRGLERLCDSVLESWIGVIRREKSNQVNTSGYCGSVQDIDLRGQP